MKSNKLLTVLLCRMMMISVLCAGCLPEISIRNADTSVPEHFITQESVSSDDSIPPTSDIVWRDYFQDMQLLELIDTALENNQELTIFLQELAMEKNEIGARQGAYLPMVELGIESELEKVGEFTRNGAVEENLHIEEGKSFPDPLAGFTVGAFAHWEIDIWNKLRTAEKAAVMRYLATMEGRHFLVTNLIAEIANSYIELLALDNRLTIVKQSAALQQKALEVARKQKASARVTELALKRFEAQLLKTQSLAFDIKQNIYETENRINFLVGRFPTPIQRNQKSFDSLSFRKIKTNAPVALLHNRPDIRKAEFELKASELEIDVAAAEFYPKLELTASVGYSAYDTSVLFESPQSLLYSIGGGLVAPFLNRKEIEALYRNASAKQIKAAVEYEKTILNAFSEVSNGLSNIHNLTESLRLKAHQVDALKESVTIATTLFNSARAEYAEVLLTQREALESKMELIETKEKQLKASVDIYRALGGGWQS